MTRTDAVVSERVFKRMHTYSTSMPTAPSVGRYWKREILRGPDRGKWQLAVVEPGPSGADYDLVRWRNLWVV